MMSDREHERVLGRLSDYIDAALPGGERSEVERHLAGCASCRDVLEELRAVTQAARSLGPLEPPRDLWPGVAERLDARSPRTGGAGFSPFGRGWLAAAAVALIALSASMAWWARGAALGSVASQQAAATSAIRPASTAEAMPMPEELADELGRLEAVVELSRDRLDAATVHVLERNLLLIERAIEDSYRALALDPENAYVREHLERTYQRKLDYLREVSSILESAG
jgi:anti-sigma factor RsiW